jgi:NDP-sugar pyrophosphorylase family protein
VIVLNIDDYLKKTQVVVVAGGLGTRLRHRTGNGLPKPLLQVGKKPMIDRCLELFVNNGLKDFVLLIGYKGEKIKEYVGDGSRYGINVKYSSESKRLGKAGAIKFALDNGSIDKKRPCIITYPDDLILIRDFPKKLIRRHLLGLKKGCLATVVRVNKTQFRYGVVVTDDEGIVIDFQEKPFIPYPACVGIYALEPQIYNIIDEIVNLEQAPIDFEGVVVPKLVREGLLFSFTIPIESWIPVNEEKEFRRAEEFFKNNFK